MKKIKIIVVGDSNVHFSDLLIQCGCDVIQVNTQNITELNFNKFQIAIALNIAQLPILESLESHVPTVFCTFSKGELSDLETASIIHRLFRDILIRLWKEQKKPLILICDDAKEEARELQVALERCNCSVIYERDSNKVLSLCLKEKPQLLVIDWLMDHSGDKIAKEIRAHRELGHIGLVMKTAYKDALELKDGFTIPITNTGDQLRLPAIGTIMPLTQRIGIIVNSLVGEK